MSECILPESGEFTLDFMMTLSQGTELCMSLEKPTPLSHLHTVLLGHHVSHAS